MNTSARIRERRKTKGWSQSELARRMSASASTISRIEAGTAEPSMAMLHRIAGALGMRVATLLGEPVSAEATRPDNRVEALGDDPIRAGDLVICTEDGRSVFKSASMVGGELVMTPTTPEDGRTITPDRLHLVRVVAVLRRS